MSPDAAITVVIVIASIAYGVIAVFALLAQFVALRVKNTGLAEADRDPNLGRKFGLHVFQHAGMLLILAGLSLWAMDIADQTFGVAATPSRPTYYGPSAPPPAGTPTPSTFSETQRVAAGLMLSGVLHTVLFTMLILLGTNALKHPAVGRAFHMNRTMIAGLILLTITTLFCVVLFKDTNKNSPMLEMFSKIIGLAFVWGPTALGHVVWMMVDTAFDKQRAKAKRDREE